MRSRSCSFALALVAGSVTAVACSNSSKSSTGPTPGHAFLRFVNALPDVPYVDCFSDTSKLVFSLKYDKGTDYANVDTGTRTIKIVPTHDSVPIISISEGVTVGHTFSFLAIGRKGHQVGILAADSNTAPRPSGIKLRFIHAAPSQASLDVFVTTLGDTLHTTPTFAGLNFGQVSGYLVLAPGSYELRATVAGTRTPLVIDDTLASVPDSAVRTVVGLDAQGGGSPLLALTLPDAH